MNRCIDVLPILDDASRWPGCYDAGWQGEIVPEAFSIRMWQGWQTPTKFLRYEASRRLANSRAGMM